MMQYVCYIEWVMWYTEWSILGYGMRYLVNIMLQLTGLQNEVFGIPSMDYVVSHNRVSYPVFSLHTFNSNPCFIPLNISFLMLKNPGHNSNLGC